MQNDVLALMEAWVDRGVPPGDSAVMLAGMSHAFVREFTDLQFSELMTMAREHWNKADDE